MRQDRDELTQRRERALQLSDDGIPAAAIAERLGISSTRSAINMIRRARRERERQAEVVE